MEKPFAVICYPPYESPIFERFETEEDAILHFEEQRDVYDNRWWTFMVVKILAE